MNTQTWIRLPSTRKGDKCPVSGYGRRKLQQLIYGIPSQGIEPKVKFRRAPGGRGGQGTIYVHVPSLMKHLLGEDELQPETIAALRALAASPDWCQRAVHDLLSLVQDRAGMTAAEFICWLLQTSLPSYNGLFPDRNRVEHSDFPDRHSHGAQNMGGAAGAVRPLHLAENQVRQTAQAAFAAFPCARP